jgi:WD40 repeat protein
VSATALPPSPPGNPPRVECPYRGLVPYTEMDAEYFFGRTAEREIIAANLVASHLTLLYAPTGVGKSSVLLAGVVRDLQELSRAGSGGPQFVPAVARSWSGDALDEIEAGVRAGVELALGREAEPDKSEKHELTGRLDGWATTARGTLLVVLDQFEEFLLYHGEDWDTADSPGRQLADALRASDLRVHFLIAVREDALAGMDRFKGHVPHLFDTYLRLKQLDRAAAQQAVEEPLKRWNCDHPDEEDWHIEPALTAAVLTQVAAGAIEPGRAGGGETPGAIEAPFLQIVLTRIWDAERKAGSRELRVQTLQRLGGAREIVRTHLDREMGEFSAAEQDIAAEIFNRLVTPSGAKIALSVDDLAKWTGVQLADIEPVLDGLARSERRIVRPIVDPAGAGTRRFEIFHDVLADPVLEWRARHVARREAQDLVQRAREEARRRLRRRVRRTLVVLGSVVLAIIVVLAVIAWLQRREAVRQNAIATSRELAATARSQLGTDPELAVLLAGEAMRRRSTDEAAGALRAAVAQNHGQRVLSTGSKPGSALDASRGRLLTYGNDGHLRVWGLVDRRRLSDIPASSSTLTGARYSPDGARILTSSRDGEVTIWDGQRPTRLHGASRSARQPQWEPAGRRVLAVTDGFVSIWDSRSGRLLRTLASPSGKIVSASWQPRTQRVLTADAKGGARLWDARDGRVVRSRRMGGRLVGAEFDDRGAAVVAVGKKGMAWVWNVRTGRVIPLISDPPTRDRLLDVAFDHKGTRVATAAVDHRVRIWNAHSGALQAILTGHGSYVRSIAFSPDDSTVATGANDRTVRLWNPETGEQLAVLRGHAASISDLVYLKREQLVSAGEDGDVRLWRAGSAPVAVRPRTGDVDTLSFSDDGALAVLATESGVERWSWRDGRDLPSTPVSEGVNTASISPNGEFVVVATAYEERPAGQAQVFRLSDGGRVGPPLLLPRPDDGAVTAAYSPNGRVILTAHRDGAARLWTADTHRLLRVLGVVRTPSADATLLDAQFAREGRRVATVGAGGIIRVFDVDTGRQLAERSGLGQLNAVAIQPGGSLLAAAGEDAVVRLWNIRTGETRELTLEDSATAVAFSPSGTLLATASYDRSVRLWDTRTGQLLAIVERTRLPVLAVASNPDGHRLVVADYDGGVRVLDCDFCGSEAELLRVLPTRVSRDLTKAERDLYLPEADG